ncbi:MAG: hypothetical protein QOD02_2605, partial [Mycobacterium sp.]|nr:hypothetical protein [Mycobacterium sp.]MDT5169274.1 hypothetical protein [Mycobacterium sp.]MDT5305445.1 hypothetical protein [Mycobacterium sp.]MDT7737817.1 hypothetical protein [Mycobacterium sp.]
NRATRQTEPHRGTEPVGHPLIRTADRAK